MRTATREFVSRCLALFVRRRRDAELTAEIRMHLELLEDDYVRRGMSSRDARAAARRDFGGVEQVKEQHREQREFRWLGDLGRDLRHAVRLLVSYPGFALIAVLSMAVGIGVNCAIYSFAEATLLRPLPVPRANAVLTVGSQTGFSASASLLASYREFVDIRDQDRNFEGLAAFADVTVGFAPDSQTTPKFALAMLVSGDLFRVMGLRPAVGRDFLPEEDEVPGRNPVVILGHTFWTEQMGADRAVIGRTVRLNGVEFTVVGVAPEGFTGLAQYSRFDFFAPLMMWPRLIADPQASPLESRDYRRLAIRGRLKPGVTIQEAQAGISAIAGNLGRAYPESGRNRRFAVRTELQNRIANAPPLLTLVTMLSLLSGAVLLVACANVAGLIASRAPARARELAIRMALGAGRWRVVRQLVTENLLIATIGSLLGLWVDYAAVKLFSRIQIPADVPIAIRFEVNDRALLVSLGLAIVSAVMFGLAPAIRAARTDFVTGMKESDAIRSGRRRIGRSLLVGSQVALSVVLLVVAVFISRGFARQLSAGPGFRTDHLVMMSMDPTLVRYREPESRRFFEQLVERARLVSGVESATLTRYMPMDGLPPSTTIVPEGMRFPPGIDSVAHASSAVDEQYFETLGLPIVKGRAFRSTDTANSLRVAIVNEVLAERYWHGQDPIGKRFRVDGPSGPWVEIVGVARASNVSFAIGKPYEFVYFPFRQRPMQTLFLLVHSRSEPSALAATLREVVRALEPDMPVGNIRTMDEQFRLRSTAILDVVANMISAMGAMGLALAIVGLYGLVAYTVSRRTREIGIRIAIGAGHWDVLRMVWGQGVVLALAGLAAGLLAGVAAAGALARVFPGGPNGDGRTDVVAFAFVAGIVLAATLLAAFVPARRVLKIDPTVALRAE
jgi:predicted permease